MADDMLGQYVIAKTAPGKEHAQGQVVGYSDVPMVLIQTETGKKVWWRADLCILTTAGKPK